jgi:hypothetical protein
MRSRLLALTAFTALAVALVWVAPITLAGQAALPSGLTKPTVAADVPRTPDGKPDMQGFWNAATLTPLERQPRFGDRAWITVEEAEAIEKEEAARRERLARPSDGGRAAPPVGGDGSTGAAGNVGGYNNFWIDRGSDMMTVDGQFRTSIIVDPPNGRVPELTPEAKRRAEALRRGGPSAPTSDAQENQETREFGAYDDVELRPLAERCIISFGSSGGPPALPVLYNNIKQIVQTPTHVMILIEMVHDVRSIRLNDKHAPPEIRKWLGDSIGRWEGDTLVVETTNFTPKTRFRGSSENLKVTERFTRVTKDQLLYQFTVEDPSTWDRSWSGEYTWVRSDEPIYEYACHEHNYALEGIMKGERLLDKERRGGTLF